MVIFCDKCCQKTLEKSLIWTVSHRESKTLLFSLFRVDKLYLKLKKSPFTDQIMFFNLINVTITNTQM